MKKQKKMRRLNRTIARITMIGYSAVLVLLLLLDWYMIRNHQENLSNAKRNILDGYTEQVKSSIDKVDQFLYDIYSTDKNFQALQREQSSPAEYSSAYELREKLRTRIIMQDYLSSFYIFYGNGEKCWYGTQDKFSDFVYSQEIKKVLEQYQANASQGKSWSTVSVDGKTSLFVCYKKGGVSMIGVYTLPDLEELIEKNISLKAQVCVVQNGDILSGKKQANQLRLLGKISENEESLEEITLDYQLFGRKLSNMNFWICTVYPVKLWQTATALQVFLLLVSLLSVFAVFALFLFVRNRWFQPLPSADRCHEPYPKRRDPRGAGDRRKLRGVCRGAPDAGKDGPGTGRAEEPHLRGNHRETESSDAVSPASAEAAFLSEWAENGQRPGYGP